jgi:hypothetical protein
LFGYPLPENQEILSTRPNAQRQRDAYVQNEYYSGKKNAYRKKFIAN